MKHISTYSVATLFVLMTTSAWAGNVTIPHSFTSGTPAVAAEVNDNFTAVKSAVNDNNTRISNNETGKQNRVTGACDAGSSVRTINDDGSVVCEPLADLKNAVSANTANTAANTLNKQNRVTSYCGTGYSIRVINSDGSVTCQQDTNSGGDITGVTAGTGLTGGGTSGSVSLQLANGTVSVSAAQFRSESPTGCNLSGQNSIYWLTTSTNSYCNAVAGVQLPQGATLENLSFLQYDNDSAGYSNVMIMREDTSSGSINYVFKTPSTTDSSSMEKYTDSTHFGVTVTVNNNDYAYYLW